MLVVPEYVLQPRYSSVHVRYVYILLARDAIRSPMQGPHQCQGLRMSPDLTFVRFRGQLVKPLMPSLVPLDSVLHMQLG